MSTFGGVMHEFPDIRVDYFRQIPGRRPPRACFLSHVHSDHLVGLDSFKSPFVYCSPATKELLLRLERYPHRLNFASGILESRRVQYKHLKNLLKPIPLETPTRIELEPGNDIQVTLFDANHCPGAVMFLIEGNGKAVLYTGDIRSEPWFVNNLTKNPFLVEYTSGIKRLDCIYLDTSNTDPVEFPTKADGLRELIQKVSQYPPNTVFHFSAWTFGYEEVWMALSKIFQSPIHVDDYKLKLYQSLRGDNKDKSSTSGPFHVREGPVLAGYQCGNAPQAGCLTSDRRVRFHSCERYMNCEATNNINTVQIRPIITRTKVGAEIAEVGVGGGGGDLSQRPEVEFDSELMIDQFLGLFGELGESRLSEIKQMLYHSRRSSRNAISLDDMGLHGDDQTELKLKDLVVFLAESIYKKKKKTFDEEVAYKTNEKDLPRVITFPYSRHSSYFELCHLVRVFNPMDVYPCTVDEKNWHEGVSMSHLFGPHCTAKTFRHDTEMRELLAERQSQRSSEQSQMVNSTQSLPSSPVQGNAVTPLRTSLVTNRDSHGEPRAFDAQGNEPCSPAVAGEDVSTPPRKILAMSPGSESQNLRRKAILDGLGEARVKRMRLEFNSLESSQISADDRALNPFKDHEDADQTTSALLAPTAHPSSQGSPPISHPEDSEGEQDFEGYWDSVDEIYRCKSCGHELWSSRGQCTGCSAGEEVPYCEVMDPELGPRPTIALSEYELADNVTSEERADLLGSCLDFDSSAYDSQDERNCHEDEYEINSFIDDDSPQNSEDGNDSSSSDGETDYKEKFRRLQATHQTLIEDYAKLIDEHEELKQDVLGSDYDGFEDMGEVEEEGMVIVDVSPPDPVLAELVLSQTDAESQNGSQNASRASEAPDSLVEELVHLGAEGQSQESEVSAGRAKARAEAFEAAVDGRWHDISMVSTNGNHSREELEL